MLLPVADGHCDFLYGMYQHGYDLHTLTGGQTIHLPYLQQGGVKLQLFAAWIDRELKTPYLQQCITMIDAYYNMLENNKDTLQPFSREYTPDSNKIATVLTVEGGEAIEGSLGVLRTLKRLGVTAMTLTWNHNNELAGAALRKGEKGLTPLGREVVLEMEHIGMAVDVSHLSDTGIEDVLELSSAPVFASHSNARSVFYSARSLEDAHIKEIAANGGVIGVNFFFKQLTKEKTAHISDIVRHIMHMVKIGGIGCCALGSDFDGMSQYPKDLPNSASMQALLRALSEEGFTEEEILRISYWNLHDYLLRYI